MYLREINAENLFQVSPGVLVNIAGERFLFVAIVEFVIWRLTLFHL